MWTRAAALASKNQLHLQDKQRLDAFLSEKLPDVSRAKLQSGIKEGLVTVNGALQTKSSHRVRWGDNVRCKLPPQQELDAAPEVCLHNLHLA